MSKRNPGKVAKVLQSTRNWILMQIDTAAEKHPIAVGAVLLATIAVIVLVFDLIYKPELTDILVEAHGLLFDLVLFGVVLLAVDSARAKRERIIRYKEELQDYRGWREPEASYRISGLIRRILRDDPKNAEVRDLRGIYLAHANLSELDCWGVNLVGANLEGANLVKSRLGDADFSEATMNGASFAGAVLFQAKFIGTQLVGADFQSASFNLNVFDGANLRNAKLRGANLNGVKMRNSDLTGSNLIGILLSGDLSGSDFSLADMRYANFGNTNLSNVKLAGAKLDRANLYKIEDIADWESISSIRQANVHTVTDAPTGDLKPMRSDDCPHSVREFKKWALANGAVDLPWDEWVEYRKQFGN